MKPYLTAGPAGVSVTFAYGFFRKMGGGAPSADPRAGGYQPERAHRLAWERQRRPKASKLAGNPVLRAAVQGMLDRRYSPTRPAGGSR